MAWGKHKRNANLNRKKQVNTKQNGGLIVIQGHTNLEALSIGD